MNPLTECPASVESYCEQFEAAWHGDQSLVIEELLTAAPPELRSELLPELVQIEAWWRRRRGESPTPQEYADRFPQARLDWTKLLHENRTRSFPMHISLSQSPVGSRRADDSLPVSIGGYRVVRELGGGTFGIVYLAHDDALDRALAIKVPRREVIASLGGNDLYLREARALAKLDHPHIVQVYEAKVTEDGSCFIVSQYIEGRSLAMRIEQGGLGFREAVTMIVSLADALQHAHEKGLYHRDVKPDNILLDARGKAYLADFGLALKEAELGRGPHLLGTPAYMSPEQARGEGHRVDGRSDIFSLGIVFFETLTGKRPFLAENRSELLDRIANYDAPSVRQKDRRIPRELDRICSQALARHLRHRYSSASAMADDLRAWLDADEATVTPLDPIPIARTPTPVPELNASPPPSVPVVPKGLTAFDAADAGFFLKLTPGPRDREGLPEIVRFWKQRIEETDADCTFAVGLLYGPSGCGKSSLVKAGLMPRLASHVVQIHVESTAAGTEARLLRRLRNEFPDLVSNLNLMDSLAGLRRGHGLPSGRKVLLVLDQFEQWLHAQRPDEDVELVRALRQCDGGRVQALVLVRDDFWMAVNRFFDRLDIPIEQYRNSVAVDLFEKRHAHKVLKAFGQAYGAFPEDEAELGENEIKFIELAVNALADEGRVISVRLALFADMMKQKAWIPATLKEVGGAEGVGVAFLDEAFDASTAPPHHRLHQRAAQAVLKHLLPEVGTDIRGRMRSQRELLRISGYDREPKRFEDLLRILDGELRLITPTEAEHIGGSESECERNSPEIPQEKPIDETGGRFYQLTHDYLVPSLRTWLTRRQKETSRGRAEIRLAERTALWNTANESRNLPVWWEWLDIRLLTQSKGWTLPQRKMMRQATQYHMIRGALVITLLIVLAIGTNDWIRARRAEAIRTFEHGANIVDQLVTADIDHVPEIIKSMVGYRTTVDPKLRAILTEPGYSSQSRLRASLALLPVDGNQVDNLFSQLLIVNPAELRVIRNALQEHSHSLSKGLWRVLEDPKANHPNQRLRAACALAMYDSNNSRWDEINGPVVERLVTFHPDVMRPWMEALRPVKGKLIEPLCAIYRNHRDERTTERELATRILADYAAGEPNVLADLVMDADENQFAVVFPLFQKYGNRQVLLAELEKEPLPSWEAPANDPDWNRLYAITEEAREAKVKTVEEQREKERRKEAQEARERQAWRQANAAVTLLRMNQPDKIRPLLTHGTDPRVRSYVIHRLAGLRTDPNFIVKNLPAEQDVSVRRALLLSLGEYGPDQLSVADRESLMPLLLKLYRDDPDPGVHGATEWLLRQWQQQHKLQAADQELTTNEFAANRGWYVNRQGQTMVVIARPVVDKQFTATRIDRAFCIAAREVTVQQFGVFFKEVHNRDYTGYYKDGSPTPDCPAQRMSWYQAAHYCNWLSQKEGIPERQWCYLPNDHGKYGEGMKMASDWASRVGYRLPTEAEWVYACRAGTVTSRPYGESDELLGKYAWYKNNCMERSMLPGLPGKLGVNGDCVKPNDFGLFDMLGNVSEWCQDHIARDAPGQDPVEYDEYLDDGVFIQTQKRRKICGASCSAPSTEVTSAFSRRNLPIVQHSDLGFRVARTVK